MIYYIRKSHYKLERPFTIFMKITIFIPCIRVNIKETISLFS